VSAALVFAAAESDWHKVPLIYDADGYDRAAAGMRLRAPVELDQFRKGDRVLFLAEIDGRVAGTAGLVFRGLDAGPADGVTSANVNRLHVVRAERYRGIASELMAAVEDEARRSGFRTLMIEVEDDNVPARSLYDKLGYELTGAGQETGNIALAKAL
jgi:GNAT superfamily N-acetyltransferase